MTETAHPPRLELDEFGEKLEAFYVLRKTNSEEASAVLDQLGANSTVDRDIVLELASKRPLGHPERFWEAHTMAVRSLEVLDRNGTRSMPAPRWMGPLGAVPKYFVGLVVGFVVKSHLRSVIDGLRRLYTRREAACALDDPARPMLTRARLHAERLTEGFRKNPLGVPGFVLGGAFVSALVSSLQDASGAVGDSVLGTSIAVVILLLVFAMASWVFVKGAAVAHRRIKLTTTRPLEALYETIGRCGSPPRDQARMFALGSIGLLAVALFVLPAMLALLLF